MKRKRRVKRLWAMLLTVVMCVSLFSAAALAEGDSEPAQTDAQESVPEAVRETPPEAQAKEEAQMPAAEESGEKEASEAAAADPEPEKAPEQDTPVKEPAPKEEQEDPAAAGKEEETKAAPEEKEEDKKEEEADESRLEDQTIQAAVYGGGDAQILLTGRMPAGTIVKAYPVRVHLDGIEVLAAYDITIFDAEGQIYQPQDGAIQVQIQSEAIRKAAKEKQELVAYHMEDTSSAPESVNVKRAGTEQLYFLPVDSPSMWWARTRNCMSRTAKPGIMCTK